MSDRPEPATRTATRARYRQCRRARVPGSPPEVPGPDNPVYTPQPPQA